MSSKGRMLEQSCVVMTCASSLPPLISANSYPQYTYSLQNTALLVLKTSILFDCANLLLEI